jgi:hypothetical protein
MISNQAFESIIDDVNKLNRRIFERLLVREGIYGPGELDREEYDQILNKETFVRKVFTEKDEFEVVDALIKHRVLSEKALDELRLAGYEMPDFENRLTAKNAKSSDVQTEEKKKENFSGTKKKDVSHLDNAAKKNGVTRIWPIAHFVFISIPEAVGRIPLDLAGKGNDAAKSTSVVLGYILIIVTALILWGVLDLDSLKTLFEGWWRFFFPVS